MNDLQVIKEHILVGFIAALHIHVTTFRHLNVLKVRKMLLQARGTIYPAVTTPCKLKLFVEEYIIYVGLGNTSRKAVLHKTVQGASRRVDGFVSAQT
jgi:hypothetical protein